jgi:hypothetical protein
MIENSDDFNPHKVTDGLLHEVCVHQIELEMQNGKIRGRR